MDEYIKREDALDTVLFALVGTGLQSTAIYALRDVPTADVEENKDCEQCIHFGKHATEYPCSHCRNCYTDKFQPRYTRTPKERGAEK